MGHDSLSVYWKSVPLSDILESSQGFAPSALRPGLLSKQLAFLLGGASLPRKTQFTQVRESLGD